MGFTMSRPDFGRKAKITGLHVLIMALIAIGFGTASAVLNVATRALTPPVPNAGSLWWLHPPSTSRLDGFSPSNISDLRSATSDVSDAEGYIPPSRRGQSDYLNLQGNRVPVATSQATPGLFQMLGDSAYRGRLLNLEDARTQYDFFHVAVISAALWRDEFGSDPHIIGKTVEFHGSPYPDGTPLLIVGVLADHTTFPVSTDIWVPLGAYNDTRLPANAVQILVRTSLLNKADQLQSSIQRIAANNAWPSLSGDSKGKIEEVRFLNGYLGPIGMLLAIVSGICVAVVILVAANVIIMILVRLHGEQQKIAIQIAIGATKADLLREQAITIVATTFLSIAGSVAICMWTNKMIVSWGRAYLPTYLDRSVSSYVLSGLTVLAAIAAAAWVLLPTVLYSQRNLAASLGSERSGTRNRKTQSILLSLSTVQLAATVAILCLSISELQHYQAARHNAGGIDLANLKTISLVIPKEMNKDTNSLAKILALAADELNRSGQRGTFTLYRPGDTGPYDTPLKASREQLLATANIEGIGTDYFKTFGIPMIVGREFQPSDLQASSSKAPQPMILDSSTMRALNLNYSNAVGSIIEVPGSQDHGIIIGVASHVSHAFEGNPSIYVPAPDLATSNHDVSLYLYARTKEPLKTLQAQVEMSIRRAAPSATFGFAHDAEDTFPLEYQLLRLGSLFGDLSIGIAIASGSSGIYCLILWTVLSSQKSICVRMAFGASWLRAVSVPILSVAKHAVFAVVAGAFLAVLVGRALASTPSLVSIASGVGIAIMIYMSASATSVALLQMQLGNLSLNDSLNAR